MVLMAALFFTVQGFSQAHAVSNGGLDHSHDGVACEVTLIASEQEILTPPAVVPSPFVRPIRADYVARPTKARICSYDGRAPPPRGPPSKI
jgi:hypothetical protein